MTQTVFEKRVCDNKEKTRGAATSAVLCNMFFRILVIVLFISWALSFRIAVNSLVISFSCALGINLLHESFCAAV